MTRFVVTYPAQAGARFDADYYVATHLPLVRETWTRHGLVSATALIPDQADPPYLAIAMLDFADGAALDAALQSPEAATVFGDVPAFTDLAPVALRCEPR